MRAGFSTCPHRAWLADPQHQQFWQNPDAFHPIHSSVSGHLMRTWTVFVLLAAGTIAECTLHIYGFMTYTVRPGNLLHTPCCTPAVLAYITFLKR